jgi:TatD DNase family protein
MRFHDVHCHLPENYFYKEINSFMQEWLELGLEFVVSVSDKLTRCERSIELSTRFEEIIPGIGIHPWKVKRNLTEELRDNFRRLLQKNPGVILGEVGLDHHFIKKEEYYPFQEEYFRFFLELSEKNNVPINIHGKGAEETISEILTTVNIPPNNILMHWYTGPQKILTEYIDRGYFFSINPSILSGSPHINVLKEAPFDQILTESDGNIKYTINNERIIGSPALIPNILEKICEVKGKDMEEITSKLHENSRRYLNLN